MSIRSFPNGTEVFFWNGDGDVCYGIVQSSETLEDGTLILAILLRGTNDIARLPAAAATRVSSNVNVPAGPTQPTAAGLPQVS